MAFLSLSFALAFSLLTRQAFSLQVSPGSPCASACLDNPADPTTSTTLGSDISCLDSDYSDTPAGTKFMSCVSCLQTSAYSSSTGSYDQEWFLYNLRYTLDSCLFGFTNATDAITTPCSTESACGPLQKALEDGNLNPSNESAYSYCQADSNAFLGSSLSGCVTCLQDTSNEKYLANFMRALNAGCGQPEPAGTLIGIQGSVFSAEPINITYPGYNQNTTTTVKPSSNNNKGLPQGAIIGIAAGLGCLLIVAIATLFVCYRKREKAKKMKGLKSPLDARFGATNITAPTDGSYGNPYTAPSVTAAQTWNPRNFSRKELDVLGSGRSLPGDMKEAEGWADYNTPLSSPPQYSGSTIPAHQAYIPTDGPVSPAGSTATSNTYISNQSGHSSPRDPPPAVYSPPYRTTPVNSPPIRSTPVNSPPFRSTPVNSPPFRTTPANSPPPFRAPSANSFRANKSHVPTALPLRGPTPTTSPAIRSTPVNSPPIRPYETNVTKSPPVRSTPVNSPPIRSTPVNSPPFRTTPANSPPFRSASANGFRAPSANSNYAVSPPYSGASRRNIPPPISVPTVMQQSPREIQLTELQMPSDQSSLLWPPSRFSPQAVGLQPQYVESSRISPAGLHSKPNSPPLDARPPSRSASRAGGILQRATSRAGIGNSSQKSPPIQNITGPLVRHAGRFDFELAEKERREKEVREGIVQQAKNLRDETPVSAESPEQWPGSY